MASAEPEVRGRPLAFVLVGLISVLGGVTGLSVIGYWYTADTGWTGSGSTIVGSRAPIVAAALVGGASLLFGLVTVLIRDDVPPRSPRGAVLLLANVAMGASVWFGVRAYPQVQQATLIGLGDAGRVKWQVELPMTEVFGVRDKTTTTITIEGRADRRECRWQFRSVKLDRSTGDILDVETLPMTYGGRSQLPPQPAPLQPGPGGFDVEQGSAPFVCLN